MADNKKPIVVLVDTFHLFQALTGIKSYTQQLCEGLLDIDDPRFRYVTFPSWKNASRSDFLRGKTSIPFKLLNHLLFFSWKLVVLPLYIFKHRVDVVIAPDFVAPKTKDSILTVPVLHDLFFWEFPENYNPVWLPIFKKMIYRGIHDKSVILTTSHYIKNKINTTLALEAPIEVAYQSFAAREHQKAAYVELSKEEPFFPDTWQNTPFFLHAGVFDSRKNIPFLIEAFREFRTQITCDCKLVLIGSRGLSVNHDDWNVCKRLIERYDLSEHVWMPGFVSDNVLKKCYQLAHAYVFPSLEEGFGIPILEAMNEGLPVLVSSQGPLKEIGDNAVLAFDPKQVDSLTRAMKASFDPALREELIAKGKERVRMFTQQQFAQRVHQVVSDYVSK
ncbi:MAG: glycosyltransferase family 4 protein [Cyclobacteriaceae bacterium]